VIDFGLNPFDENIPIHFYSEFRLIGRIGDHSVYFSSLGSKVIICTDSDPINRKLEEARGKEPEISKFLNKKRVISIFVTTHCNCNCAYCYAKGVQASPPKQSFEKIREFLDAVIDDGRQIDRVRFQGGGEPTTEMPLIKKTIEYAKSRFGITKFEIQTNLLFSEKNAGFIGDNFSYVCASVDGPEEIQAKHRRVSPEENKIIKRNLRHLPKRNLDFSIKCTVSKYSNEKLKEIVDYFSSLGVKTAVFEPVFEMGNASAQASDFNTPPEFSEFLERFTEAKKYGEKKGFFAYSCFLPLEHSGIHYCGGTYCEPCLTTDGYISTCDEHFVGKGDKSPFIIGKMDRKSKKARYNESKIAFLKGRIAPELASCSDCFLKWSCRGQCPSRTLAETGDIYKPNPEKCKIIKQYSREYLLYRARAALDEKGKHI